MATEKEILDVVTPPVRSAEKLLAEDKSIDKKRYYLITLSLLRAYLGHPLLSQRKSLTNSYQRNQSNQPQRVWTL
jgi:hypothetical protein